MDIKMDLSASSPESDDFKVSKISSEFLFLNDFRYVWFAMIEQQAIILTRWPAKVAKDFFEEQ